MPYSRELMLARMNLGRTEHLIWKGWIFNYYYETFAKILKCQE
jgi:hypothetical protein